MPEELGIPFRFHAEANRGKRAGLPIPEQPNFEKFLG